jgi:preprotein translocase subunit Sss1
MKDMIANVLLGLTIIGCIGMAIVLLRGIWNGGIDEF